MIISEKNEASLRSLKPLLRVRITNIKLNKMYINILNQKDIKSLILIVLYSEIYEIL